MTRWGWALAIAVTAVIALVVLRGDDAAPGAAPPATPGPPAGATTRATALPAPQPAARLPAAPALRPGGVRDPLWGQDAPVAADPLEAYLAASIYPPQSRPLGRYNDDLLQPNQRHEEFRPVDGDDSVSFRFTADRYFVNAGDSLVSTLEVRRGDQPMAVEVTAAFLAPYQPGQLPAAAARSPLAFRRHGGLYANQVEPVALARVEATTLFGVYIEFDHGAGRQRAMFTIHLTPAPPARFTGENRDYLADGSLVVAAGLEVDRAGYYLIDCNLYDSEDNPVAWTRFKGDLAAGSQSVPLEFFGKVLVDSQATPPFHIGQLRGARFVEGREPDLDAIPMWEGEYQTRTYQLADFSDAPYDSPAKRARIDRLRDARERGVHGFTR